MCHVQIHCENAEALIDAQQRTFDAGFTGPEGHYISRPAVLEVRLDVASCMLKIGLPPVTWSSAALWGIKQPASIRHVHMKLATC